MFLRKIIANHRIFMAVMDFVYHSAENGYFKKDDFTAMLKYCHQMYTYAYGNNTETVIDRVQFFTSNKLDIYSFEYFIDELKDKAQRWDNKYTYYYGRLFNDGYLDGFME